MATGVEISKKEVAELHFKYLRAKDPEYLDECKKIMRSIDAPLGRKHKGQRPHLVKDLKKK